MVLNNTLTAQDALFVNIITIRRTTKIRNSFPNSDSALNLICALLIEKENTNYRKYPVTAFSVVKDVLEDKIEKL